MRRSFFRGETVEVAKKMLGCVLVRETVDGVMAGVITETEAYTEDDAAAHSFSKKRTPRNEVMFRDAGHLYVYFTYGMHHCMNVVSEGEGRGCAALIRAIQPVKGIDIMRNNRGNKKDYELTNGPGKVCHALGVTLEHNGVDITQEQSLIYLLSRKVTPAVLATPRVGISKAKDVLWRFVVC